MPLWAFSRLAGPGVCECVSLWHNGTGGPDVIRKEAWPFYSTIFGVRLCWELEEPQGF